MNQHYVERDISKVLINEDQLKEKVAELGQKISADYAERELTAICILRGCVVFFADLIREISIPMSIEFMALSSYGSEAQSTGNVKIKYDLENNIRGKDVLIVEDIIDTGYTLHRLIELLKSREPRSIEVCCLLDKQERREVPVPVKYTGFTIPDEFVVGYGLDYDSRYRNYSSIGILKREVYET